MWHEQYHMSTKSTLFVNRWWVKLSANINWFHPWTAPSWVRSLHFHIMIAFVHALRNVTIFITSLSRLDCISGDLLPCSLPFQHWVLRWHNSAICFNWTSLWSTTSHDSITFSNFSHNKYKKTLGRTVSCSTCTFDVRWVLMTSHPHTYWIKETVWGFQAVITQQTAPFPRFPGTQHGCLLWRAMLRVTRRPSLRKTKNSIGCLHLWLEVAS